VLPAFTEAVSVTTLPEAIEPPDDTELPLEAIASVVVVETGGFAAIAFRLVDNDVTAMSPAMSRIRRRKTWEIASIKSSNRFLLIFGY
jgi:hypothetical protein